MDLIKDTHTHTHLSHHFLCVTLWWWRMKMFNCVVTNDVSLVTEEEWSGPFSVFWFVIWGSLSSMESTRVGFCCCAARDVRVLLFVSLIFISSKQVIVYFPPRGRGQEAVRPRLHTSLHASQHERKLSKRDGWQIYIHLQVVSTLIWDVSAICWSGDFLLAGRWSRRGGGVDGGAAAGWMSLSSYEMCFLSPSRVLWRSYGV